MPPSADPVQTAMALLASGKHDQAQAAARRILHRHPDHPTATQVLALALLESGKHDQALFFIRRALEASPGSADLHHSLAAVLSRRADPAAAEQALRRALELSPDHLEALLSLGTLLLVGDRPSQAEPFLARAHAIAPHRVEVLGALAHARAARGDTEGAVALVDDAARRGLSDPQLASIACGFGNYTETDRERIADRHRRYGELLGRTLKGTSTPLSQNTRHLTAGESPGRPPSDTRHPRALRIGYLSPDLRTHAVARFFLPALEHRDRARFEAFCYHVHPDSDADTERIRAASTAFRHLPAATDAALLQALRADRLDILVELSGHTTGHRLAALARRAAPVQCTWIGYPATTGSPAIDYRIIDAITDPAGAERFATERLLHLPRCFLCFSPPTDAPPVSPRPSLSAPSTIVFGSFNQALKISPHTLSLWSALLGAVPGSRLLLKAKAFADPAVRSDLAARFRSAGLDPARLELLPMFPGIPDHLAAYGRIDIALDTFPYNGTTTTCEALLMGVPVLTLAGEPHAARVGASLLAAAGLPELVATTPEQFVALGAALAADRPRLAALSAGLRDRLLASELCDGPSLAAALEAAFLQVWSEHAPAP